MNPSSALSDFIREIVAADVAAGKHAEIVTRFPPEPNGYLHIGHAKAIALNFGMAAEFGGHCNLRFDDTNPVKEEQEYIDSIQADIRWLGYDWGDNLFFASDYFEQLYEWAEALVRDGKAYVDDLSADEIREYRGTLTEPGRDSPWRDRAGRREPGPVRADARRRVRERRAGAAREDRHGLAEHQPARPDPVSHRPRDASAHGRRVVHLSDVRLRARPVATRSRASRTRCARSSSRRIGRSTTG